MQFKQHDWVKVVRPAKAEFCGLEGSIVDGYVIGEITTAGSTHKEWVYRVKVNEHGEPLQFREHELELDRRDSCNADER